MPQLRETSSPPVGPLHVGYYDANGPSFAWRPKGTKDWLFICTEKGQCRVRFPGGEFHAGPGDVILYQPGTPQDYGQHSRFGRWKNAWVHWVPRPQALEWLTWPEISAGIRHLFLPRGLRSAVIAELSLADSALRSNLPRGDFLATNAVERALLLCCRTNPREEMGRWHPRIQQAVEHLTTNLRDHQSLESVARRFGFSRSRFAALFRAQVGQAPGQYLEAQRLAQARHYLSYTNQTLIQIADQVGFASPYYLSLRFKKHFGKSPRAFRKQRARARERLS